METLLFDSYRIFQKEYNGSIIRRFFKLPIPAVVLFFLAIASLAGTIALCILGKTIPYLVCLILEVAIGVIIFFYTENYQLKTIDKRLEAYVRYCGDVYVWLSKTGFVATSQNIQDILIRVNHQTELQERISSKKSENIRHIIDVLLVPFLLAIFSLWMTEKTELSDLITGALAILTAVGVFGMIAYIIYSAISFYRKRKLEQWRCFASDLQGVLDTQFETKIVTGASSERSKTTSKAPSSSLKKQQAKNAGKPWTKEDDSLLCEMYDAGLPKKDIAKHFMRSPNSISARLVKLKKIPNRASF